ncbi:flavin reductase family protein [Streptomyces sp. NPDC091972]|uniref:flavin reductase family protein n=1 Tax=Streptomyces sp. NPDC091972 TaxID=3366007 RepID=UPI00381579AA
MPLSSSPPSPRVTSDTLRQTLAAWPTGVTVITAEAAGGRVGLVCNSFTSVSLDPPLVSWCVDRRSTNFALWKGAESFAVHILAEDQTGLIERFARRGGDKFTGLALSQGLTGAPLLSGTAARLECRTWQRYDGGDHIILVGQVVSAERALAPAFVWDKSRALPA